MMNTISTDTMAAKISAESLKKADKITDLEQRVKNNKGNEASEWYVKHLFQAYLQKVMLSDGTDPDNEPEW